LKPATYSGLFVILGAPHGGQPRRSHIGSDHSYSETWS
jgi:hypothetical protein